MYKRLILAVVLAAATIALPARGEDDYSDLPPKIRESIMKSPPELRQQAAAEIRKGLRRDPARDAEVERSIKEAVDSAEFEAEAQNAAGEFTDEQKRAICKQWAADLRRNKPAGADPSLNALESQQVISGRAATEAMMKQFGCDE